ncbi:MAG: hypothetical protein Q9195_009121 [Heterodermia aff. obscurata]
MPKQVVVSSGFGCAPHASEHSNRRSSGKAQQRRVPAPEPERVVVDLTRRTKRHKHQGQGHQGNTGDSNGHSRRISVSSSRTPVPASPNPGSHLPNEDWRRDFFFRVQVPAINAAMAQASSSHIQPRPESHHTSHTKSHSSDSHRRAVQTPISNTSARGRQILPDGRIPPFRDPSPSIAPSESISTISERRRRLAAEEEEYDDDDSENDDSYSNYSYRTERAPARKEEYDDDDYENDDSYSSYSYRTERPPTRKEERYIQKGPRSVGDSRNGRPVY